MIDRSLSGLSWANFFIAQTQIGFGAFLTVYLTSHAWSATDVGFALSLGTIVAMVAQVPAGALVDAVANKRHAAMAAILVVADAALLIAIRPALVMVVLAMVLQAVASTVLTPAIAAITLALSHQDVLGERLGRNVRFGALGSVIAAGVMGLVGYLFSHRAIFFLAGACGLAAVAALGRIDIADLAAAPSRTDHLAALPGQVRPVPPGRVRHVLLDPSLLVFAACVALFQLGNAAMLPIAANAVTRVSDRRADLVIAAAIVVPQLLAAMLSPGMGRAAQRWGRRPVLLLGFAAMPLRALLFAIGGGPVLLVCFQALDGVTAAVLGMMIPLVVADITRLRGRFNLAMGAVGLAVGVGATLSTGLGGLLVDRFGSSAAFLVLGAAGLAACLLVWLMMPETGPPPRQV